MSMLVLSLCICNLLHSLSFFVLIPLLIVNFIYKSYYKTDDLT